MEAVFESYSNFVSVAVESGFFKEKDKSLYNACIKISRKVVPTATKNVHRRNSMRLSRYWNTYKKDIQQTYVNIIF